MLTIRAMVRVGPWTVTQIEFADEEYHCQRCDTRIKYIWVCEVDADSVGLFDLNGQAVWRIGSTCGPTLMQVSDAVWNDATRRTTSKLQLLKRVERLMAAAVARGDVLPSLFADRRQMLIDGTLEGRELKHLGFVMTMHERRLKLRK